MTWKSYAAVSGATVLAGWLASSPASNTPAGRAVSSRPSPRRGATSVSDIEQQATRLQSRLRAVRAYNEPHRNPFRFAGRAEAATNEGEFDPVVESALPPVDLAPAAPRISVAGIAEEQSDGRVERTAILSSPMGVLLVREGEEVLGYYRVTRIDSEAVELVGLNDGTATRLTLGASQ
jgi:hypothetical protein